MTATNPGAAPADPRLARLYDLVLERLIDFLADGLPVHKADAKTGELRLVGRSPAPPAYVSAAIKLLKDAGQWDGSDPGAQMSALLDGLPAFGDDEVGDAEALEGAARR